MAGRMAKGGIAVIFVNRRSTADPEGYAAAAAAMERDAPRFSGYRGIDSVRDAAGHGITISWWTDEAAAAAWRADAAHRAVQAQGRDLWYDAYAVAVAEIRRSHAWTRDPAAAADD